MADRKITDLAELTSPVAADLLPIVVAAEPTAANKNKKIQYGTFLRNIPSGTVGAPSIAWTADSGVTGFYRSAANEIAFATNSTFQGKFTTAGFQLGTGTAAAQLHLFSADTTDQVIIENTDAGLDTAPDVVLYRNSASPANNDNLGNLEFRGKDSAGNDQTYAQILSTISTVTNTSEVGILDLMSADAGVSAMRLRLKGQYVGISESNPIYPLHVSSTVSSTALQLQCTVNDASSGGDITMYRRRGAATVGQNNDLLSTIYWRGHNDNATTEQVDYAAITGSIVDVTNNLEDGKLELKVQADGALTTEVAITAANTTLFGRPIIPTHTPASETATGTAGEIAWDNGYLYVCTATNTWKKVGISTSGTPGSTAAFSSGSAAAPSITFADDTNTGAFNPAADAFAITTGGTERLRITSAGRVGIGTISPSTILQCSGGASGVDTRITVGNNGAALQVGVDGSNFSFVGTNQNQPLYFFTNGTERARITSAGLVGIGTTSPGELLHVNGGIIRIQRDLPQVLFRSADGSSNQYYIGANISNTVDGGFIIGEGTGIAGGTPRITITGTGNVGIGTTSPGYTLDVAGNTRIGAATGDAQIELGAGASGNRAAYIDLVGDTTYTDYALRLIRNSTGANAISALEHRGTGEFRLTAAEAAPIAFLTTNTERARIDNSGRLLVGTSTSVTALVEAGLQVHGTGALAYINSGRWSANNAFSEYIFSKSRGASVGTRAIVQNGDGIGGIQFTGDDGTSFVSAASIAVAVDGTPGTNDMPGRIVLATTLDGASSPTEALRITNDRVIGYNQAAPVAVDATATLTVANLKNGIITSTTAAAVTGTLPTGTLTEGGFSGLYTNFTFQWTVINTGATNNFTVAAGTDHTVVGNMVVAAGNSGRFATRRTAANTFVTYRLSS